MICRTLEHISEVRAADWNALVPSDQVFLRHEFLDALEKSACVGESSGWIPLHQACYENTDDIAPSAVVPLYLKTHSWGEYIFDWAWAQVYQRMGLDYYPKLVSAVPFTPVTGKRILGQEAMNAEPLRLILAAVEELAETLQASSVHWLFTDNQTNDQLLGRDYLKRTGQQLHWRNKQYRNFDEFLATLKSSKRKKIRRERRKIRDQDISFEILKYPDLQSWHLDHFYRCYSLTVSQHGAIPYLNRDFFSELADSMRDQLVIAVGNQQQRPLCAALYLQGESTLYGRYWGTLQPRDGLHFETCYYQAIDYCIKNQLEKFEAGAQGEHKLSRGLTPVETCSAHWIRDPRFHRVIGDHLLHERQDTRHYIELLEYHSPYKQQQG